MDHYQRVSPPHPTSTLKPFVDGMAALVNGEGVSTLAAIMLWKGFLNHDEWLFGLSDEDFDWFMDLWSFHPDWPQGMESEAS